MAGALQKKFNYLLHDIKNGLEDAIVLVADENNGKVFNILQNVKEKVCELEKSIYKIEHEIPEDDLLKSAWQKLGSGSFGQVFKGRYKGTPVAIKVLNFSQSQDEENLLKNLSHNNIVAFRGMGYMKSQNERIRKDIFNNLDISGRFIVMEYISDNLARYVERQKTHENQGLSASVTWNIAGQIIHALGYLHTLSDPIAHRDLKPDNILLDTGTLTMQVKLADFGLSCHSYQIDNISLDGSSVSSAGSSKRGHVRWSAPEVWPEEDETSSEYDTESESFSDKKIQPSSKISYLAADVYSYGMVLAFALTGEKPLSKYDTQRIMAGGLPRMAYEKEPQPKTLTGPLLEIIKKCRSLDPEKRPSADDLIMKYFSTEINPYQSATLKAEFFSCGFLKGTQIFVADSLVEETTEGFRTSGKRPRGYDQKYLICEVDVKDKPYNVLPEWDLDKEEKYNKAYQKFRKMANDKIIDDNPAIALKNLILDRAGEEEEQKIELKYAESSYCHHRAMREMWRDLSEAERAILVPTKGVINSDYSTSFGLHVAVLTNEGPGNTQKFIFPRRSKREGMSSPGAFTCGAVESSSVKDYNQAENNHTYVSLINTAARGLDEELRVYLDGDDLNAIILNTIYLKFDTHEWGLCGFVDLTDHRIDESRRLSFNQLKTRFSSGSLKDKFEHEDVHAVDFELEPMVRFVRNNHTTFASSAKLVVVKVLQAFFGVEKVEKAFQSLDYATE